MKAGARGGRGPLLIVLLAVAMNVASAVVMKLLANRPGIPVALLVAGFTLVVALHGARLVVWGACHRRYPLSRAFPLSSLFFPLMLPVALAFGEPVGAGQCIGALMIFAGVFHLSRHGNGPPEGPAR